MLKMKKLETAVDFAPHRFTGFKNQLEVEAFVTTSRKAIHAAYCDAVGVDDVLIMPIEVNGIIPGSEDTMDLGTYDGVVERRVRKEKTVETTEPAPTEAVNPDTAKANEGPLEAPAKAPIESPVVPDSKPKGLKIGGGS